ncbi:MAG: helix-turn-helix domain-containing protein [bacterium]|nr:helix-turn-helix domain-containing protein [bacterium]
MARPTFEELRERRLNSMSADERAEFDEALAVARLAMEVGEKVRGAREAAGLTQRDLAARMSTSQAAVARLEAGGTSATLATLHKAAAAIGMTVTVDLAPAD